MTTGEETPSPTGKALTPDAVSLTWEHGDEITRSATLVASAGGHSARVVRATRRRSLLSRCGQAMESLLNRGLAAAMFVASMPLFIPIALAVFVTSGLPIFYRGERLGRHKKPYQMFKFRTLVPHAELKIGGRLLARDDELVSPIGWFLRDTRLDELPQLLNIVLGDMHFVGPRPVRREVYEQQCRMIPGYDRRFRVKPGLIGLSQVFTPHNTPKRIRTLIDHRMMSRRFRPGADLVVLVTAIRRLLRLGPILLRRYVLRRYRERRRLSRVHPERAAAILEMDGDISYCRAPLLDISDSAFVIVCGEALGAPFRRCELVIRVGRNGGTRRISAPCRGSVSQVRTTRRGYEYVIDFQPTTDRSLYLVHQHFLKRSLAMPG